MDDTMLTSRVEAWQGGNSSVHIILDHESMKRMLIGSRDLTKLKEITSNI
jgi:hypothetical protein